MSDTAHPGEDSGNIISKVRPHEVKSLLMATDLSGRSDHPLARAVDLASRLDASLTVLHVIDEDLPAMTQDQVADAARTALEAHVAQRVSSEAEHGALGPVTTRVVVGRDYHDILASAEAQNADMIVLGVHRNDSGLIPISGTTMEKVIRKGSWPVLVVTSPVRGPYKKVLVAVDFSIHSRSAIRGAFAIAPDADFHMIHAYQLPFEGFIRDASARQIARQQQDARMTRMIVEEMETLVGTSLGVALSPDRIHKVPREGDVHDVLQAEIEALNPDLLVLGTHGRAGVAHMVMGSVAEAFLNHPPCDVLAVKAW